MDLPLAGKSVLTLIASGFEEKELTEPQRALLKAGANFKIASVDSGLVNGWHGTGWGHYYPVDAPISEVLGSDYNFLLLPGGERSINKLKQSAHARRIVTAFLDAQKPIAVMGHGAELLALSGPKLKGRTLSAPLGLKETLTSLNALWVEEAVTVDKNIISAAHSSAMTAFIEKVLQAFSEPNFISQAA